jgi:hypothetical protein
LLSQSHDKEAYSIETAKVIAKVIIGENNKYYHQYVESYSLKNGLKEFGSKGYISTIAEIKQLHRREVFRPIKI